MSKRQREECYVEGELVPLTNGLLLDTYDEVEALKGKTGNLLQSRIQKLTGILIDCNSLITKR